MKYEILAGEGHPLKISSGKIIHLKNRAGMIISTYEDMLVIPMKVENNSPEVNFLGLNEEGEIAWKFNEGNYLGVKHRFIKAWVDEEGDLWVKNLAGKEYKLDYKTGEVLATRWENMDFDYDGNRLRIGDREVEFEITEAKKGDRADCFNGRETEIKMVACWRGKRLFVLYGRQDTDPTKPTIGQGERVASFDAEGNQKWDKSEEFSPQGIIYYLNVIDKYLYVENGPYGIYADIKSGKKIREEMLK